MSGWIFDAPGGVHDFRDPMNWHNVMAAEARGIVHDLVGAVLGKDPGHKRDAAPKTKVAFSKRAPAMSRSMA
jgi:hypothetical protein